jgi:hypothetical protein
VLSAKFQSLIVTLDYRQKFRRTWLLSRNKKCAMIAIHRVDEKIIKVFAGIIAQPKGLSSSTTFYIALHSINQTDIVPWQPHRHQ